MSDAARSLHRMLVGACVCDGAQMLEAAWRGAELPLCPVHDGDRIADRDHQRLLEQIAEREIRHEQIVAKVRELIEPKQPTTPDEQPIVELLGDIFRGDASTGTDVPLGGAEIDQALADALGLTPDQGH